MKSVFTLTLFTLFLPSAFSQNSSVRIFTDDGQRFSVFVNGENQNPGLSTQVNFQPTGTNARVKVMFENHNAIGVEKTIPVKPNTEYVYQLKRKFNNNFYKEVRKIGNEIDQAGKNASGDTVKAEPNEILHYSLQLISEKNKSSANAFSAPAKRSESEPVTRPEQQNVEVQPQVAPVQSQTTTIVVQDPQPVYSTTTTVNTNTVNNGQPEPVSGLLNISMNVGGAVANTSYQETTTTTTTTVVQPVAAPAQQVYVMPGYNGPVGCPWPMSDPDFRSAKASVEKQSFSDNQLQVAKQIVNSNCLTSSQVRELMMIFSFEDTKLDLAKYCYGYTYDLGNYYKVNDAFTFSSSVDELNQYIQSR